jgi:1,4-dihydroxy-6-naphthoate synthase
MTSTVIRVAHSPDSDDAFMFYALATGKLDTGGLEFINELHDIETLNRAAVEGKYEVTAASIHAYAYLHERYALLGSGASMGEGYGPLLVSARPLAISALKGKTVAVPGEWTSAFLALKLCEPGFLTQVVAFDQILPAVENRVVDAGILIHEGQLLYKKHGLHKILDLGQWWNQETGLPLPLGGNLVRRDLGREKIRQIAALLKASIRYALDHREEALNYALQFGRGLDQQQGDRFVSMYVNERTLDYGEDGRKAVRLFLDRGWSQGLIPRQVRVDFV